MSAPAVNRDRPDAAFIAAMQQRYPLEREIEWAFTRRLERRAQGPYRAPSREQIEARLRPMLREHIEGDFDVRELAWLGGGGSKLQLRFTLATAKPLRGHTERMLVLRMEPAESLNPSSRQREAEALAAVSTVLPVPEVYWVDRDGHWFGEPALIYSFSSGVAKPKSFANQRVTGLGTNFGALRDTLATQFVESLARLHTLDLRGHALGSFDLPALGSTEAAQWQLHRALRCWEEDRAAPSPLMDLARSWLQRQLPTLDHVSLLHGDYRSGNFLFDEGSGRITAILDWERTTVGDRHRDLAWATSEAIGHYSDDGRELLMCGLMPVPEFLRRYAELSGLSVNPARLRFYTVLSHYQQAVTVLATGYRVVRLRRSHQDVLLARIEAAAYVLMEELRQALASAFTDEATTAPSADTAREAAHG